ncbi:S8 family serine peptidase [Myroides odoratimimus]|uniref:S8 family peptidase n=1 Tax=Myroides odoratimimus TaxID=76832 RepID=UPI00257513E7|nr:S8 family peptidase [Myroides odoratimimus]MDM1509365.1 S8 family serine peptidase [Myroides odoratimimus]MDM1525924.1 S8 family serine peptidase [Myroides odoratimimus]MEC4034898.1 S8 family peptidase [Myroides odoratimimus]MEC4093679.1 S8 family peptidase [Myroides odoratimimus]
MRLIKPLYLSAALALALTSCGTTSTITNTPISGVDNLPKRTTKLTEEQLRRWSHLDIINDTVPGMSVDRAYEEILKGKKLPKKVIVGVVDSGIEIDHDDLKTQVWTNPNEIAGNGIDDDNNGYIDDIHGWNFLGQSVHENVEMVRVIRRGDDGSDQYKRAVKEYDEEVKSNQESKLRVDMLLRANERIAKYLDKKDYTMDDLNSIPLDATEEIIHSKNVMYNILAGGRELSWLEAYKNSVESKAKHHLNLEFDGRKIVGDDHTDINDRIYGDNNVIGPVREEAKHGTHVAGIIAQTRGNNLGGDGVASDVAEIMAVRAVPDGDEYDKDIALGIRYAVDNGAKVINGSFGKYYEENSQWVRDAIKYAEEKDVLIVVAAGNDAMDLNIPGGVERYPNDNVKMGPEISNNFLVVGALNPEFGKNMVARFSNYGDYDVDVFAPGVKIYATVPTNSYEYLQGTSMASPNVAGVAALVRAYYPEFTAGEVKKIIMDSGVAVNFDVVVGEKKEIRNFQSISTSGKFVNAYNALLLAEKLSKAKK